MIINNEGCNDDDNNNNTINNWHEEQSRQKVLLLGEIFCAHSVFSSEQMLAYYGLLSGMLFWGSLESVDVVCCSSAQVESYSNWRVQHTLQIAEVWSTF